MAESEVYISQEGSAYLVHPDYQEQARPDWFDSDFWGEHARPVGSGGRGSAWFVDAEGRSVVLRRYLRGGLIAHISKSRYVFTHERHVRSFAEFRLLVKLTALQLPVPKPVAAWYRKVSWFQYEAAIIVERIEGAMPLAGLIEALSPDAWQNLGGVLRRFHDAGVCHADLNCFNILVHQGNFSLIDFDRGKILTAASSSDWRFANLERLARSLRKVGGEATQNRIWGFLLAGYERAGQLE